MANETEVLQIDFGDTLKRIEEITKATSDLRIQNQELEKAAKGDSEALNKLGISAEQAAKKIQLNQSAIRVNAQEQRTLNKVIDESIKANKAQEGSIESNRAKLSLMTQEYLKLAAPTKEQTERLKTLTETLKKQEAAYGDNRRNVGNYAGGIKEALAGQTLFGVNLGKTVEGLQKSKTAMLAAGEGTKGFSGGLKVLKAGLAGLGIGLIIAAIGFLFNAIKKIEPVTDKFEQVVSAVGAAVSVVVGSITRFFSILTSGAGLLKAITGGFGGMGKEMKQAAIEAAALTKATQDLEDATRKQSLVNSEADKSISNLIIKANDKTKTDQERIALIKEANRLEEENFKKQIALADEAVRIADAEFARAKRNRENEDDFEQKFIDAKIARNQLEQSSGDLREKLANRTNALTDEISERESEALAKTEKEREQAIAAAEKAKEKKDKLLKQALEDGKKAAEDEEKAKQESLTKQLSDSQQYFNEQQIIEKENYANSVISKEEFNSRIAELKEAELTDQINILETFGQEVADKEIELNTLVVDAKIADREKDFEHQQEIAERTKEINEELLEAQRDVQQAKIELAGAAFNIIEEFAKEESALAKAGFLGEKALAIAQVIVSAQEGFVKIAANLASVPPVIGVIPNPLYPAAAALAIKEKISLGIQTGIALASIAAQTVKGFLAEGGEVPINVGGKPHSQGGTTYVGEDGNAFEVERGENIYVLKKTASEAIGKYSTINQMYGGKSWQNRTRFAAFGGGIETASTFDGGLTARAATVGETINNFDRPIMVSVTEINKVQNSVAKTVEVSEL